MILKSVAISRAKISSRSEALFPGNVYVQASSARVDKYEVQTISYSDNLSSPAYRSRALQVF